MSEAVSIPERQDDPTIDDNVAELDPIEELRAMDEQENRQELEAIVGDEARQEYAEANPALQNQEAPQQEAPPQGESAQGNRPGFDTLIRDIENNLGPEHAAVAREMQRDGSRRVNEAKELQDELRSTLLDVREIQQELDRYKNGEQPEQQAEESGSQEDPMLATVRPEQWELFEKMAQRAGYIKKDDVEQEMAQEDQAAFIKDAIDSGIETYGQNFGTRDGDGDFVPNETVKPLLDNEYERVMDPNRGLTLKDLFVLANHDQIVEAARQSGAPAPVESAPEGGRDAYAPRPAERREAARRAAGQAHSNSSARTTPNIYSQGDRLEDVVARATLLSARQI
tara:strand:- start:8479 stop:9498 length:1020 start_codon:yes stop_codon:yes gene_type:complete